MSPKKIKNEDATYVTPWKWPKKVKKGLKLSFSELTTKKKLRPTETKIKQNKFWKNNFEAKKIKKRKFYLRYPLKMASPETYLTND